VNLAIQVTDVSTALPARESLSIRRPALTAASCLTVGAVLALLPWLGTGIVLAAGDLRAPQGFWAPLAFLLASAAVFAWRETVRVPRPGPAWTDRSTGLYNRAGLFAAGNQMVRARASGVPVSLVLVEFADLAEVREIYGDDTARKVVAMLVRKVEGIAGLRGMAGRTGAAQFTIVLPGASREKALRALRHALGKPACVEFDAGDSEIVLVPDLLVDTADARADSVEARYRDMCGELVRMQNEERRRQHCLARERVRHSRPMA
jgi:GGDEF domain-containing protein